MKNHPSNRCQKNIIDDNVTIDKKQNNNDIQGSEEENNQQKLQPTTNTVFLTNYWTNHSGFGIYTSIGWKISGQKGSAQCFNHIIGLPTKDGLEKPNFRLPGITV